MVIWESNGDDDHRVYISLSAKNGDRVKMVERNNDENDIPVLICYNLGSDFCLRTEQEKRNRVLSMLEMLRIAANEAIKDIGRRVGAKGPQFQPRETGEAGGPGFGGKMVQGRRKHNYQMGGREIVTSANIPCHSIESCWRETKLGPRGGRPPCPGGLPS
jgi:hypothetical protein